MVQCGWSPSDNSEKKAAAGCLDWFHVSCCTAVVDAAHEPADINHIAFQRNYVFICKNCNKDGMYDGHHHGSKDEVYQVTKSSWLDTCMTLIAHINWRTQWPGNKGDPPGYNCCRQLISIP